MEAKSDSVVTGESSVLTDEVLEQLAGEWESDTWSGLLTNIVVGRPRIMGEELVNVTFRIPKSRLDIIEDMARRKGVKRSEYLREAVDKALVSDAS